MAAVYAATQQALGRSVAIKVVTPTGSAAAEQLQRLENEAQALAGLHHPNIVDIYQFGRTEEGALYYVMPLLRGGDLRGWPRPVAEQRVIDLLDDLLSALVEAHSAGIVHRDIKPENILFDQAQRPRLADFGAALRAARSRLTGEGLVLGSSGYMSPEQARGGDIDARSDLYSLAVVGYELLTGALPFDGPDDLAIALAQCEQSVPRLPRRLAHWQAFFDQALHRSPASRFADAGAMRHALQAPRSPTARLNRLRARPAMLAGIATLVVILLVTAAWRVGLQRIEPADVAELIERGALLPPDDPNALDVLLEQRVSGAAPAFDPLVERLLTRLADDMKPALLLGDVDALQPLWQRWHDAMQALQGEELAAMQPYRAEVERVLGQSLGHAARDFDRRSAAPALALLDAGAPVSPAVRALAAEIRALPLPDRSFHDDGGPDLWLVRGPSRGKAGFAVMSAPVSAELYAAFAADRGRRQPECAGAPSPIQGCIGLDDASALADWLGARTGQRYRVPTRPELEGSLQRIDDVAVVAWTTSCNMVTSVTQPNVAQRAWGGVRSVFGGQRAQPRVERSCSGHLGLPLDGVTASPRVLHRPGDDTAVVLIREVRPLDIEATGN